MYRELLEEAIKELEPEIKAVCAYHVMGSEDFAYISREIPPSYMCIGVGIEDVSKRYVEHNPKVRFHEPALVKGAAIYAVTAMRWLELHGNQ